MTWTSKSPSYQGLRTPSRVIAGRWKMTVLRTQVLIKPHLELLSWNYLSLLLNRSTDRPTHFRENGGDGWGGGGGVVGNLLKGKPFHVGGLRVQTSPFSYPSTPAAPHFVGSLSLRFSFANSFNIIQQSWTQLCCAMLSKVGKRIHYFWSHLRT